MGMSGGLSRNQRFLILETVLTEGKLPPEASGPIRQWLTEAVFADIVALCQFMPGPASSQTGMAIGLLRGGNESF